MMASVAARELADGEVVFVGIGLPNLACNLARATHAPRLVLIYESGAVGAVPERLPVSIGDPALVTGSLMVCGMADVFQLLLQNGRVEVGFLGGAQVDRYGNINTTVIGARARAPVLPPPADALAVLRGSHRGGRRHRDHRSARGRHGGLPALARAAAPGAGRDPVPGAGLPRGGGGGAHGGDDPPPPRARGEGAGGARRAAGAARRAGRARLPGHAAGAVAVRRALAARAPGEARGRAPG